MNQPQNSKPSRRSSGARRHAWLAGVATLLVAGAAWAGSYSYSASHTTKKTPEHVLSVLTAYGNYCNEGCKYYGPDVKEFVQVSYKKTATAWYTWTYVSTTMKDVKYFNRVTLTKKDDGSFVFVTRQLDEKDAAVVKELTEKTGKEHSPAFDTGKTVFTVTPAEEGKTKVVQSMSMTASGMLDMFGGKIKDGMKAGAEATFKNIEK